MRFVAEKDLKDQFWKMYKLCIHPQISFKIFLEKTQKSAELTTNSALFAPYGAREENRTPVFSLEG